MADGLILEFEGFGEGDLVEGQEGYFEDDQPQQKVDAEVVAEGVGPAIG
jgi:hypothetical protein